MIKFGKKWPDFEDPLDLGFVVLYAWLGGIAFGIGYEVLGVLLALGVVLLCFADRLQRGRRKTDDITNEFVTDIRKDRS